jgi:hypothetical protein
MYPVKRPLVAVFTQRYAKVLLMLDDVVRVTRATRITDPTVHFLDLG